MNLHVLASVGDPKLEAAFLSVGALASAFAVLAALSVSLLGILYMTVAIAPNATQKFSGALREHNIKSFFAGLGTTLVMLLLLAVTHHAHGLTLLLLTVFGAALIPALAAGAEDIGRRLFWASGKEGSRASHLAGGWLVFAFGSIFPVIGWFVIFPYVTISGLGSLVVGPLSSGRPPAAPAARDIEFPEEK
jgi:hypothetical protein